MSSLATVKRKTKTNELKTKITWKEIKRQKVLLIWSAIIVAYGLVFYYAPLVGWIMGFQNYKPKDGLLGSKFVGFDKFKLLFSREDFIEALRNTFAMGVINLVLSFVTAIVFALLLNEVKNRYWKKFVQTISYLPHFLSWVIVAAIAHEALSLSGIVNEIVVWWKSIWVPILSSSEIVMALLEKMNISLNTAPVLFFGEVNLFWILIGVINVWKETGWNAILYLAAITAIDPSLYEAASIDGAGRFNKMWHITLPGILPTIVITLLMNVGNVLNVGFEAQYLLGNDVVKSVSETIDIYVLNWGIGQGDYALGTAAGIFKSVVSIALIYVANLIAKIFGQERLF